MTDEMDTLGRFLSKVDAELDRQTKDSPLGAETVLTKIKILFPDTYLQMEKEGVLQRLENPEGLRTYLHEFFKKHRESNLPEHVEPRATEVSPGEVAKRTQGYENAAKEVGEDLDRRSRKIEELRASYVKRVTQNFIDQTRAHYDREAAALSQQAAAQIEAAQKEVSSIPGRIDSPQIEMLIHRIEEALPQYPQKSAVREAALTAAKETETQYNEAERRYARAKQSVMEAKKQFFRSDNPTMEPAVFLSRAVKLSDTTSYAVSDVVGIAELQARVVEFQNIDASGVTMGGHGLWTAIANPNSAREKALAPLADFIFDNLHPEQQARVVRDVIDKSLGKFEKPVAQVTETIGKRVATSNAIRMAIRSGDLTRGAPAAGHIGGLASSVFASFGGVNMHAIEAIGHSGALEWLSTQSFYAYAVIQKLKTTLGTAGKFVLKEGAGALAKKVGGFGLKKLIGGTLGSVFGGPVGAVVGSFVTDVVIGKTLEWGGKIISGAGYLMSGGVFTSILQGKPASLLDTFVLFPVVLMVALVALFVFPWFLNLQQFPEDVRRTALLESMEGGGNTPIVDCRTTQTNPTCNADVPPVGIDCNATQTNPQCKIEACIPKKAGDCMWPTTGYITQGPQSHCGTIKLSHASMNAIDIGASYNTPVITVKDGQITAWESGCADQPLGPSKTWGCNGGWGNYIDITGGGYTLRYAHLALQSMGLTHRGMQVSQGQVIGKVDNNGNSSGNHLHFGVQSGGNILSILPVSPQQAQQIQGCVNLNGCPNACPAIPVSTH